MWSYCFFVVWYVYIELILYDHLLCPLISRLGLCIVRPRSKLSSDYFYPLFVSVRIHLVFSFIRLVLSNLFQTACVQYKSNMEILKENSTEFGLIEYCLRRSVRTRGSWSLTSGNYLVRLLFFWPLWSFSPLSVLFHFFKSFLFQWVHCINQAIDFNMNVIMHHS